MSRLLPFPLVTAALWALWLLLNQSLSPGHILLGGVLAVLGALPLRRLELPPLKVKRPVVALRLALVVAQDVIRSNFAVAGLLLSYKWRARTAGFITIPLDLRDPYGLAVLATIISNTPGTLWVRFDRARGLLMLHVFDLVDEGAWVQLIKTRYERPLMEIFE